MESANSPTSGALPLDMQPKNTKLPTRMKKAASSQARGSMDCFTTTSLRNQPYYTPFKPNLLQNQ
ncbi:MAG TPA: hypothetical protein DD477_10105 [Spirochaetaceae bacterium]|nr:hypothetical protein [Spirochaetaceae bacterium]